MADYLLGDVLVGGGWASQGGLKPQEKRTTSQIKAEVEESKKNRDFALKAIAVLDDRRALKSIKGDDPFPKGSWQSDLCHRLTENVSWLLGPNGIRSQNSSEGRTITVSAVAVRHGVDEGMVQQLCDAWWAAHMQQRARRCRCRASLVVSAKTAAILAQEVLTMCGEFLDFSDGYNPTGSTRPKYWVRGSGNGRKGGFVTL